ncbi:MarR family winged helix-turn-helix transcriptional regulator [Spirillospora sp. NBC_00431]
MTGPREPPSEVITPDVMQAADYLSRLWAQSREGAEPSISSPQFDCLLAIDRRAGPTINELAEALAAAPSSVSRLCDRLQAAGLVERETPDVDRRKTTLVLTRHGRQLLHQVVHRRQRDLAALMSQMSVAGRAALLRGLSDLQAICDGTSPKALIEGDGPMRA